jgi:hypothetical protein
VLLRWALIVRFVIEALGALRVDRTAKGRPDCPGEQKVFHMKCEGLIPLSPTKKGSGQPVSTGNFTRATMRLSSEARSSLHHHCELEVWRSASI